MILCFAALMALGAAGVQEVRFAHQAPLPFLSVLPIDLYFYRTGGFKFKCWDIGGGRFDLHPFGQLAHPPSQRHRALRTRLALAVLQHVIAPASFSCIICAKGRVSIWLPSTLPLRPELLHTFTQRLAEEAAHGRATKGFKAFIDLSVVSRTYVPNPENRDGGKIIRKLP